VCVVAAGGGSKVSAQSGQGRPIGISGVWNYKLIQTNPNDTTYDLAQITQANRGALSGTVQETGKTCAGSVSGVVRGTTVTMMWRFPQSCSGDVLYLSGQLGARSSTMSGSVTSSDQRLGTFDGKKQ
jgi:hypothetical protein